MIIEVPAGTSEAWQLLHRARQLTGPRIRRAVDRLSEPVRTVARYHFGWCDAAGQPAELGWGKGVRGALVLASARALGAARPDQALDAAAAIEMIHNFSVLHDDVMDGDAMRRGRRTAWTVFGTAQAVLAGDALLVLAVDALGALPRPAEASGRSTVDELCQALLGLVAGQSRDLAFEQRSEVALAECLTMAEGKTASLIAGACALGAICAGATPARVADLRAFGHHLGLAFQLVDDLLGIWGDAETTGKPAGADLRSRKKSLPVVAALDSDTRAASDLAALYHRDSPLTDAELTRTAALIEEAGGRAWAEQEAERQRHQAARHLSAATPDPQGARILLSLADLVIHRDR